MQNLVPHFILEKQAAGESNGRFAAIALFIDISGFSTITNTLVKHGSEAAESMADVMLSIFEPFVDEIYRYDGFITTFAGDAFTALFPANEQGELGKTIYQQALAAATAIQQHMVRHPVQTTPYGQFPFSIKLGLGVGDVEWGILQADSTAESAAQHAYYFSGEAIQQATDAEHYAQSGNLILTAEIATRLADYLQAVPVGDDGHQRLLALTTALDVPTVSLPLAVPAPGQTDFMPEAILERTTQGEFRQTVSVFINLGGIHSSQDLALFMGAVFELQKEYGGYLGRIDFGDKGCNLLLFWGMPTATENDIERALNFILALGDYTPGAYKAGITYRPMFAGLAGSARRNEYTAYGGGVSYAARLMVKAAWGCIWLDERVAARAGKQFVIEAEGSFAFKGFTEPQAVYELVERREIDILGHYQGEFVGRKAELVQLRQFVEPILPDGDGTADNGRFAGALVVEGEAGLGKTRLVAEFLHQLTIDDGLATPQWFLCQADQTVQVPLGPFRYWLHHYFNQSSDQSETRNKRAFGRKLNELLVTVSEEEMKQALDRGRSFLGALVGLHWPNSLYTELDAQARYEWTLTSLKRLIQAESQRQPVVVNMEDVQWFDEDSQAFVTRLVRQLDPFPIAILATSRPIGSEQTHFAADVAYGRLTLTGMAAAELALLAEDTLVNPITADVAALLTERAEGNPFFAEQILLYLKEEKGIILHNNRWQLASDSGQTTLPADVHVIFTARLDRLLEEVKEVVQTAAVLGREFELKVLEAVLSGEESLPQKVAAAEVETIWSALSQVRYLFRHGLLRDAAYEMQLRADRRRLHKLAATAYETIYAEDLAQHYAQIAYHYEAAYEQGETAVRETARRYLRLAGQQTAASYENSAAIDYFSRALTLTKAEEAEVRYRLLLAREAVYNLMGQRTEQKADLDTLQTVVSERQIPLEQAEISLRFTRYMEMTNAYEAAIDYAQETIRLAQISGSVDHEADALIQMGRACFEQSKYDQARQYLEQALVFSRLNSQIELEATTLNNIGLLDIKEGLYAQAQDHLQQSDALYEQINERRWRSRVVNNLGNVAYYLSDLVSAMDRYKQTAALAGEIGDRLVASVGQSNVGFIASKFGDFQTALQYFQDALALKRELLDRVGESITLNNLGVAYQCQGKYDLSRQNLEASLVLRRELGSRQGEGYTLTALGHALIGLEAWTEAEDAIQTAVTIRQELENKPLEIESKAALARLYFQQQQIETAVPLVAEIVSYLDEGETIGSTEQPLRIPLVCYQVLHALDDERADKWLQYAYDALQKELETIPEMYRESFLQNIPWHARIMALYAGEIETETGREIERVASVSAAEHIETEIVETAVSETKVVAPKQVDATEAAPKRPSALLETELSPKKAGKKKKRKKRGSGINIYITININNVENMIVNQIDVEDE